MTPQMYCNVLNNVQYWESRGFKFVDLPWTVDAEFSEHTKPGGRRNFYVGRKTLVASGEQSFISLDLPPGKYVGLTPCFRDEPVLDRWHKQYFLKSEVFIQQPDHPATCLSEVLELAHFWFNFKDGRVSKKRITDSNFDIECNGTELGSYGVRGFEGKIYVFGTGCAEPRFTEATCEDH